MKQVTLFGKPGCHLCEDVEAELARLQQRYPHRLELIDITTDADLLARYGERIPVIRVGTEEIGAPLSRSMLEQVLK
jgi:hypothetical protein